jgi:hypothetical protein
VLLAGHWPCVRLFVQVNQARQLLMVSGCVGLVVYHHRVAGWALAMRPSVCASDSGAPAATGERLCGS